MKISWKMEQNLTPPSFKSMKTTLSPPPLKRRNIDHIPTNNFRQTVKIGGRQSLKILNNDFTSQYEQHQQNNSHTAETGRSTSNELDILYPIPIQHIAFRQDNFDDAFHEKNVISRQKVFLLSPRFSSQKDKHSIFNEKKYVDDSSA